MNGAGLRAAGLVLPLAAFIAVTFALPLGTMLVRSVYDPTVAEAMPETLARLGEWDGAGMPDEVVYSRAAAELARATEQGTLGQVASRINRVRSGLRSLLVRTPRQLRDSPAGPRREALLAIDERWGDPETWHAIRTAGDPLTARHYLHALDLDRARDGSIVQRPAEERVYLRLFARTFAVGLAVTVLCMLLGYPIAYLIAHASARNARWLLAFVLVPFWTSLLVRTTSWIVLLQTQGVVNDLLVTVGLVADDGRLALVHNMTGTLVAMTHILLPFMVLPLYSVMRGIPSRQMAAAASLGAGFFQAFRRVYWPQTVPGVGAGSLLVFILAIGYYITPALVGGQSGQLISNFIAYHMQTSLNWGLAGALGGILLASVAALYVVYDRVVGVEGIRLG